MSTFHKLVVIMFTDIVGYTALMGIDEQKALEILEKNLQLQKPIIKQFNGLFIKDIGDAVLASFTSVSDATKAAIKIQENCNAVKDFQLRIGIHSGEVVFKDNDVLGDAVNIASRIQQIASPGSIYISESVHNIVSNKPNIETRFVKQEVLKNVKEPVRIYEVIIPSGKEEITPVSANKRTLNLSGYWYNDNTANALRLIGAADEYYLKEVVHIDFDSTQYKLPDEMNKEYDRCLAIISEEAKKRGSQFFDGPCVRLINIWESSIDASEEKHLYVTLGPINWFSFSVVDQLIHEETLAGTYNSFVEKYVNLDAIRRNNFTKNVLPNIIETVTTIITSDGYLIYALRNAVSTVADMYSATVSENIHRDKDVNHYNTNIPDPFMTVIRGIKEELSPSISENLGSDNVKLIGLCYNLDELHPTFLFLVEAPYSVVDFFSICRNNPGRDFKESVYHIIKIEALSSEWDEILSTGKWYASGKASILRSLEFLKYKHN